jgi:hypothetical protein
METIREHIEKGTDLDSLKYSRRGESVYSDGRQVLVRACHDAFISYPNLQGEKGIVLIRRKAEPARDALWCLGGGMLRGVPTLDSLYELVKKESGLDIINPEFLMVERFFWNTTPNQEFKEKNLPAGIDDIGIAFYCEGKGDLNLDKLHEQPSIITPKMYTSMFREKLHPYIQRGMDLSFILLNHK